MFFYLHINLAILKAEKLSNELTSIVFYESLLYKEKCEQL